MYVRAQAGSRSATDTLTTFAARRDAPESPDVDMLRRLFAERTPATPLLRAAAIRPVVPDAEDAPPASDKPAPPAISLPPEEVAALEAIVSDGPQWRTHLSLHGLEPEFVRLVPPLHEPVAGEVSWLNPDDAPGLLWDTTMCEDASHSAEVRELMLRAFRGALPPPQQQVRMRWRALACAGVR